MAEKTFRVDEAGYAWIGDKLILGAETDNTVLGAGLIFFLRCGFKVTLPNGWVVSCRFGSGNYCENYEADDPDQKAECRTAEMAAWNKDRLWLDWETGQLCQPEEHINDVIGHVTVEEALYYLDVIATYPEESPPGLLEATQEAQKNMEAQWKVWGQEAAANLNDDHDEAI